MEAPAHRCKDLYRLHKWLRLCWVGDKERFGVCQLYHISDCGDLEDVELNYREYWNWTTVVDELDDDVVKRVPIYRGPIFNKNGGHKPDWDTAKRIPVWVMTLDKPYTYKDGSEIDPINDVFSGKFIEAMAHYLNPIKGRLKKAAAERGISAIANLEAVGGEMADRLWRMPGGVTGGYGATNTAYKHQKKKLAQYDHFQQTIKDRVMQRFELPK